MYSIYDVEGPYWNIKTDLLIRQIDEDLKRGGQIMAGIRNDVIDTGYIPVEYNTYKELVKKAEKYDAMIGTSRKTIGVKNAIKKAINYEIHAGFKPSFDFVKTVLNDAYFSDGDYDVKDIKKDVISFIKKYVTD